MIMIEIINNNDDDDSDFTLRTLLQRLGRCLPSKDLGSGRWSPLPRAMPFLLISDHLLQGSDTREPHGPQTRALIVHPGGRLAIMIMIIMILLLSLPFIILIITVVIIIMMMVITTAC